MIKNQPILLQDLIDRRQLSFVDWLKQFDSYEALVATCSHLRVVCPPKEAVESYFTKKPAKVAPKAQNDVKSDSKAPQEAILAPAKVEEPKPVKQPEQKADKSKVSKKE